MASLLFEESELGMGAFCGWLSSTIGRSTDRHPPVANDGEAPCCHADPFSAMLAGGDAFWLGCGDSRIGCEGSMVSTTVAVAAASPVHGGTGFCSARVIAVTRSDRPGPAAQFAQYHWGGRKPTNTHTSATTAAASPSRCRAAGARTRHAIHQPSNSTSPPEIQLRSSPSSICVSQADMFNPPPIFGPRSKAGPVVSATVYRSCLWPDADGPRRSFPE